MSNTLFRSPFYPLLSPPVAAFSPYALSPLIALGAVLCFAGVLVSDAGERSVCRSLCAEQGFGDGLMRGNPHVEHPGETPRQCWCFNGTRGEPSWASDGLDLPQRP